MKEKQLVIIGAGAVAAYVILRMRSGGSAAPSLLKNPAAALQSLFPKSPAGGNVATGYGTLTGAQIPSVAGVRNPIVSSAAVDPTVAAITGGSNVLTSLLNYFAKKSSAPQAPTTAKAQPSSNPLSLGSGGSPGGSQGTGPSSIFDDIPGFSSFVKGVQSSESADVAADTSIGSALTAQGVTASTALSPFSGWDIPSIDAAPPENTDTATLADAGASAYGPQNNDANIDQPEAPPVLDSTPLPDVIGDQSSTDAFQEIPVTPFDPSLLGGESSSPDYFSF